MKKVIFLALVIMCTTIYPAFAGPAYDHVMKTGVIRCAYILYPSETERDLVTGKLSGAVVEMTEEAARLAELKVEWVAEVGFADMFEGLKSGKYDALCSGLWETPTRARAALFTVPTNYGLLFTFVRKEDTRFDKNLRLANSEDVTVAVLDGEYGAIVANESFPKSKKYSLPQLSDMSQLLVAVETGKADIAFLQPSTGQNYMKNNPGKLRMLENKPVRAMPAPTIAVSPSEQALKNLLDASFRFMQGSGKTEDILRKYDPSLSSHYLLAPPYMFSD